MRIIESRSIDNQAGLLGSRLITGTSTIEGAFQSFIVAEDTIVSKVYNSIGIDVTQKLGLTSVTLKAGAFISMAKGDYFSSIKLASGSVVAYFVSHGGKTITADAYMNEFLARTGSSYLEAAECAKATLQGLINIGLLQKASLVMSPSMYEEDLVKSVVPQDGSGDLSFTRASDGTRINSAGLVEVCPWNLAQYSEDFTNAVWAKVGTTITANSTTAPNGTLTADSLIENTATSQHLVYEAFVSIVTSYTFFCYIKPDTRTRVYLRTDTSVGTRRTLFDLTGAGSVVTLTHTSASISLLENGWYLCSIVFSEATASGGRLVGIEGAIGTSINYTGNGLNAFYLWGAQLNIGSTAKPYFPTTDRLNVPRLTYQNGGGGCPSLLLEKQSTNVVLYSGDLSQSVWVKPNYALSNVAEIQGLTATRITKNSTNNGTWNGTGARVVINNVGTFAAGTKAFSVLLRKGNTAKVGLLINQILVGALTNVVCEFDFSTETFTNVSSGLTPTFEKITTDVYQIVLVCNDIGIATNKALWIAPIDSSNNTVTDGYVDVAYFQWELGAYPTTYIPTTSASATRVGDSASLSSLNSKNITSSSAYTLFYDFGNLTKISNADLKLGNLGVYLFDNSWFLYDLSAGTILNNTSITGNKKIAITYSSGVLKAFANNTKLVTYNGTMTSDSWSAIPNNIIEIKEMLMFNTALTETEALALIQ